MRIPRFRRGQIIRLGRLLNMMYKPSEIAAEIEVTTDTVCRSYLPAGAPHERDAKGNIWIHGVSFRKWAETVIGTRNTKVKKIALLDNQAWCLKCNRAVELVNPKPKPLTRYLDLLQGTCKICGTKINRAISKRDPQERVAAKKNVKSEPAHSR